MIRTTVSAALCTALLLATVPAMAAPSAMPQGKQDAMSMKDTRHAIAAQRNENKEADKNVDSLIKNRK